MVKKKKEIHTQHNIVQLLNTEDKEMIVKATRGKVTPHLTVEWLPARHPRIQLLKAVKAQLRPPPAPPPAGCLVLRFAFSELTQH